MIRKIREFVRGVFGTKPRGRVGRFRYEEYRPAEKRVLGEIDKQLEVPGHSPGTLYLYPRDHKLFQRAARRAAAYGKDDPITENSWRGKVVEAVAWEKSNGPA